MLGVQEEESRRNSAADDELRAQQEDLVRRVHSLSETVAAASVERARDREQARQLQIESEQLRANLATEQVSTETPARYSTRSHTSQDPERVVTLAAGADMTGADPRLAPQERANNAQESVRRLQSSLEEARMAATKAQVHLGMMLIGDLDWISALDA
eukprot:scaffold244_cov416-Prasinococcus_capsulatus_cf.AAC.13